MIADHHAVSFPLKAISRNGYLHARRHILHVVFVHTLNVALMLMLYVVFMHISNVAFMHILYVVFMHISDDAFMDVCDVAFMHKY